MAMSRLRRFASRLFNALHPERAEPDLAREVAAHLALLEDDFRRRGLTAAAARSAARRAFGGVEQAKESHRDARSFAWLDDARSDLRYALRALTHNPGFTVVAIVTLAVGIGANTAIFSLVDAMRAEALPYPEPDRLVQLSGNVMRSRLERRGASYPDYLDWRSQSKSFVNLAAFDEQRMTLVGFGEPERITTEFVSAPYFSLLGVSPVQGRTFRPEEDVVPGPAAVVVLSDGLWKRRFGSDPHIVGRAIGLNGGPYRTYTVLGVMPPGFKGATGAAELWVPFALWAPANVMTDRRQRAFAVLGRLKPDASVATAQAELNGISRQLERAYPDSNIKRGVEVSGLAGELLGRVRSIFLTLMAAVALVLLIACANVANLLIARSEARRREIAVRRALGAGRGRLLRQLVTESCVLTTLGAIAGLAVARTSIDVLFRHGPVTFPSFVTPGLDGRVAVFTIAVSLVCGVLVSLAPGLHATGTELNHALRESARATAGGGLQRLRHAVIVAEVSLAIVLLVGAGLMIRSVRNMTAFNPGFDPDSVLTLAASIPRVSLPAAAAPAAMATAPAATPNRASPPPPVVEGRVLLERIRAVPGVAAAGLGSDVPLDGNAVAVFYAVEGQQPSIDPQSRPRAYQHRVSADFFSALRIPFVRGRTFTDGEMTPASTAVIVSEALANRSWPGQDPIGKRAAFGGPLLTVVGVVGEVTYRRLPVNPDADPDFYVPFLDRNSQVAIAVRTVLPPASIAASIRAAVRAADPSIAVFDVAPMNERIGNQTGPFRFVMWLMGVFATVALALAVIGIYGVMSYLVAQRTREIGIRMALGAERHAVMALILRRSAALTGVGLAAGLAGAVAVCRFLGMMLFGVTPFDPATFIAVAVLFGLVALAASSVPALRATRIDPLVALRSE